MTLPLASLRPVSARRLALDDASRRYGGAGIDVRWATFDPAVTYLAFSNAASGAARFYIDANGWIARHMPALAGLAWAAMTDAEAMSLFRPLHRTLRFGHAALADLPWRFVGLHRHPEPDDMLAIDTPDGVVLCEGCPPWPQGAAVTPLASSWMGDCTLPVDFRQGVIRLSLKTLRRASPGDVLLLTEERAVACLAGQALFSFTRTTDTFSVEDIFDLMGSPHAGNGSSDASSRLVLDGVSVTVDVIVARIPVTLGDLAALGTGSVFGLGDAGDAVRLDVGGNTIATGELVQAGDRLGVLLHRIGKT